MIIYQCPKCKSENIKEVMYSDYGILYAMMECKDCSEAGEYSYFEVSKNNKPPDTDTKSRTIKLKRPVE